ARKKERPHRKPRAKSVSSPKSERNLATKDPTSVNDRNPIGTDGKTLKNRSKTIDIAIPNPQPINTSRPTSGSRHAPASMRVHETRIVGHRRRAKGSRAM